MKNLLMMKAEQRPVAAKVTNKDDFRTRSGNVRPSKAPSIAKVDNVTKDKQRQAADKAMMT